MKAIKKNKGMTLIETTVALALLSIASVLLCTGFLTAGQILKRSSLFQKSANALSYELEASFDTEHTPQDTVVITLDGGRTITVSGNYISKTDDTTGLTYTVFVAE